MGDLGGFEGDFFGGGTGSSRQMTSESLSEPLVPLQSGGTGVDGLEGVLGLGVGAITWITLHDFLEREEKSNK